MSSSSSKRKILPVQKNRTDKKHKPNTQTMSAPLVPGLILAPGTRPLTRISGPVSISLLEPASGDDGKHIRNNGNKDPVILLLGDYHQSWDGTCEPCTCKKNDHTCCMAAYGADFLKLLDILASTYGVDFFLETFPTAHWTWTLNHTGIPDPHSQRGPMGQLTNMWTCLYRNFFQKNNLAVTPCPTKYIRYHSTDVRLSGRLGRYEMADEYKEWGGHEFEKHAESYMKSNFIEGDMRVFYDNHVPEQDNVTQHLEGESLMVSCLLSTTPCEKCTSNGWNKSVIRWIWKQIAYDIDKTVHNNSASLSSVAKTSIENAPINIRYNNP